MILLHANTFFSIAISTAPVEFISTIASLNFECSLKLFNSVRPNIKDIRLIGNLFNLL